MLMKEKTSKEVTNYALLNSISDSFYTDLIDSIEERDSLVDIFADVCREITLFVMRDFLYSVFAGTDTGYKHFSNKDAKVSVRDILNAEALLSGDFDCSDHAKALAKEYFDPTILSLLFSLRMTGDRIDDNIDLMESIFDECKGDRTYIKTANAHARDKDMAICRLLRTCYSMTSKEIAKHMGITEAKVYKLTAAWDDSKDGLYVRLYKYLYARIMAMRNRLLDDQEGKIFLRAAKNSKEYISIDTKNTFLEPETMGEEEVDDIIDDFKRKKEIEAMNTRLGVDISKYNGRCNMDLAKESGLSFVILKAGSGYSGEDPYWVRNYNACKKAGLGVGAYWYCYATNVDEALREADMFIHSLEGMEFDYPVYLDMEDKCQSRLGNDLRTRIAYAFMKRVESSGYYVGLYTMKSWLDNSFDMERLKEFDLWVARWSSRGHGYKGPGLVGMWQYTNRGHFKGIGSTSEDGSDANVAYIDYPTIIKKKGLNNYRKKK
nr:glycoside hydrolase family 25 protein [uncultured Peptostreptococcus sp.]